MHPSTEDTKELRRLRAELRTTVNDPFSLLAEALNDNQRLREELKREREGY